jgi:hypothetical protein
MTCITVNPGACGFECRIEAEKTGRFRVVVRLESRCKQIGKLAGEVTELDFLQIMRGTFSQNPIVQAAGRCGLHQSCPIPCAITKAVEAELEMAVRKDITLTYEC